jgi:predicted nucleic acid-binding protein
MKYLFDSSAIFRAIKENKIETLSGNYTLELARFELGNIFWKNCTLHREITEQEAKTLSKIANQTLNLMTILPTAGKEEEILQTAIQTKTTYYDASYIYLAKTKDLLLVTEDLHLIKKIPPTIKASTLSETSP